MTACKRGSLIVGLLSAALACAAQAADATTAAACDAPEHRQFDFWIGAWSVTTPGGKHAGDNLIQPIADGCALSEHWRGAKGGEGFSTSAYDKSRNAWHQTWVDHDGLVLLLDGRFENGSMVLQGPTGTTLNRITWTPNRDGTVRQHWETSDDEGKSWKTAFDGLYTRDIRLELERMFDSDQEQRAELQALAVKSGGADSPELQALWKRQQPIDEANLKRLGEIVASQGWPARSKLGDKAAAAAFLVVQHADLKSQDKYLPMLRAAVKAGEARPQDLALLEDRARVGHGKKQLYGSQMHPDGKGGWELDPIEDEAHVDERRQAIGLEPLADYARIFGIDYRPIAR